MTPDDVIRALGGHIDALDELTRELLLCPAWTRPRQQILDLREQYAELWAITARYAKSLRPRKRPLPCKRGSRGNRRRRGA